MENVRAAELRRPYVDARLRENRKLYVLFIRRLHAAGLVTFRRQRREACGLFFVQKSNGKQRLVLDARRSNCWFTPSLPVSLASGDSLGALEVPPGQEFFIGHLDLKDAFYHLALPGPLQEYFGLGPVSAAEAGVWSAEGRALGGGERLFPCLAALPMGWTHALYWCQSVHERLVTSLPGFERHRCIYDRQPTGTLGDGRYTIYVDNLIIFGPSEEFVRGQVQAAQRRLDGAGLITHEVELAAPQAEALGWVFDGRAGVIRPTARRAWRMIKSVDHVCRLQKVRPRDIERLIGT